MNAEQKKGSITVSKWYILLVLSDNTIQQKFGKADCCPQCQVMYDDVQRYCEDCRMWYHIGCCAETDPDIPRESLVERACRIPITRGQLHEDLRRWWIAGTGNPVAEFRKWYDSLGSAHQSDEFVEGKLEEIDGEFFSVAVRPLGNEAHVKCPSCRENI